MIKKILCVDDLEVERLKLKTILEEGGYECAAIGSASKAIELLEKGVKPDLIFLDIVMPDMDGFSACRSLKNTEHGKDIPVVFVSSKSEEADKVWAQLNGGAAYITKPYQREDVYDAISKVQS